MTTVNESVIVSGGACGCCSAPTVHVHHREYPEAVAEGVSAELAVGQLLYLQGEQPHSVVEIADAALLVTIIFPRYSPLAERSIHS
jgi:hypothetical protein